MGKNKKQCKTLPICAVHYAICQSNPYLHRHCLNLVASHTLHSYVCTVYTAHYIHVPFHNWQLINEVKRPKQLHVCTFDSSMCMCALEALLIVPIHKWCNGSTIDCVSGEACDLFHTQCIWCRTYSTCNRWCLCGLCCMYYYMLVHASHALWRNMTSAVRRTLSFWNRSTLYLFTNSITTGRWPS